MTVAVWAVLIVLFGHWMSDFVWQPDWMGKRKSSSWGVLANHAARIFLGMFFTMGLILTMNGTGSISGLIAFAGINAASHFVIDAVTSRVTSRLWGQQRVHNFFVTIGLDQMLHVAIAVLTLEWLMS